METDGELKVKEGNERGSHTPVKRTAAWSLLCSRQQRAFGGPFDFQFPHLPHSNTNVRNTATMRGGSGDCYAAIIGAGPYGLSAAAYTRAAGLETRIFGKPMD